MHKHRSRRIDKLTPVITCLGREWEWGKWKIEVREKFVFFFNPFMMLKTNMLPILNIK